MFQTFRPPPFPIAKISFTSSTKQNSTNRRHRIGTRLFKRATASAAGPGCRDKGHWEEGRFSPPSVRLFGWFFGENEARRVGFEEESLNESFLKEI